MNGIYQMACPQCGGHNVQMDSTGTGSAWVSGGEVCGLDLDDFLFCEDCGWDSRLDAPEPVDLLDTERVF